jgi:hypothetical protein
MKLAPVIGGSAIALASALSAWAIAGLAFGRIYYLSPLLIGEAFLCAIVAWFIHLGEDGFFRAPGRQLPRHQAEAGAIGPARKDGAALPLDLFAPREGLVSRGGEAEGPRSEEARPADKASIRDSLRTFLVAALELALLATALYAFAGIGAHFFS